MNEVQRTRRKACECTYLTSGIDDVAVVLDSVMLDVLGEGVLDCRIVRLDEVVLDVLDDKRGFTCCTSGK